MTKQRRADALLVMVTFFWGASYYLSDLCMEDLGPMTLNAFRFLTAFLFLGVLFKDHILHANAETLKYSLIIGLALTGTYILYGYGLPRTSISNAGFICGLPVVVTPIFDFVFCHNRPKKGFTLALILCTIGIALLTFDEHLHFAIGDLICLGVPICYAIDLLVTEHAVRKSNVDPLGIGVMQLGVVGVITLLSAFALEKPHLPTSAPVWAAALFLGIFCSGIAFVLQSTQQQYTSASHVGLIFTLEPIFSAMIAYAFAGERLTGRGIVGACLMVLSLLLIELDFKGRRQKNSAAAQ